jgi:Carboxypeptidase regulatory-like domain/TonB dependent receptor
MVKARVLSVLIQTFAVLLLVASMFGQETTAGLQGTVKDSTGAVVANAHVVLTGASLTGNKAADTDGSGYYRFANVPPGSYVVTVTAKGFTILKREGLILEVGHLPTVDFALQVGGSETVVEVSGAAPAVDVTTNVTQTNITQDVVQDVPHGRSFQSVIQFAPSARNEPLAGSTILSNGSGGGSPGNESNGSDHGFSVAGGSDSENSYLVEGQETADLAGGFSHTNVPFDFIQEVQIKSSGIEAEHGGSLGGVVNVIMKKGTNDYHGSAFMQFENQGLDGSPNSRGRYDLSSSGTPTSWGAIDPPYINYQPIRPKTSDVFPGFTLGGPILKDRIFGFIGFNPEWNDQEEKINYGAANGGITPYSQNQQTYYTTARIDASVSQKIRVFGSWLYQFQKESGQLLPRPDSVQNYFNPATGCFGSSGLPCLSSGNPKDVYGHVLGFSAPNTTSNFGADITLTPHLVATTRFGYYFQNYHDFGYPTTGTIFFWPNSSLGLTDATGAALPTQLQQSGGYFSAPNNAFTTARNSNKAIQYDADLAWFKSGWMGTHNFKFGYQLNRLANDIDQKYNEPYTQIYPGFNGTATAYSPVTPTGANNCKPFIALYGDCQGKYGYLSVYDFGTEGKVTSFNHGLFAQDAWTLGRGVTINAGVRFDKEYLPGEGGTGPGIPSRPIDFSWTDKVAPRIGAAWDVFKNGKMKVFGSYGAFYDIMKLNVAISSFGGQYWQQCFYALDTTNIASITPAFNSAGRDCVSPPGSGSNIPANWAGGTTPPGLTFLENQNYRLFPTTCSTCALTQEGVAPGLKPYRQHESVFGVDYQLSKNLSFEARWDRRRLDHVIEDSSIFNDVNGSETFVIVNPGQGSNRTFLGFCDFIYGAQAKTACASSSGAYPPNNTIPGARSYDGVEFRLNKSHSDHWFGMFSYTYSKLRGNYTGLTSTDLADGSFGGRNSPNNSRSFDEPYFSWNDNGGSSSGLLPTDRPNTFKGYAYYELPWTKFSNKLTTDVGVFQYFYQGSPVTSYLDIGYGGSGWPVEPFNRGEFADVSQDPTTGLITVGSPHVFRTPWYIQSDLNLQQNYKLSELKVLSFSATFANLFNQHSVTAYTEQIDTQNGFTFGAPNGTFIGNGVAYYANAMKPYSLNAVLNSPAQNQNILFGGTGPQTLDSLYKTPLFFQLARTIRLSVKFTF